MRTTLALLTALLAVSVQVHAGNQIRERSSFQMKIGPFHDLDGNTNIAPADSASDSGVWVWLHLVPTGGTPVLLTDYYSPWSAITTCGAGKCLVKRVPYTAAVLPPGDGNVPAIATTRFCWHDDDSVLQCSNRDDPVLIKRRQVDATPGP